MSDKNWHRMLFHIAAVVAAMAVWALPIDFSEHMLGSAVVFFTINGFANRRLGPLFNADDLRADVLRQLRNDGDDAVRTDDRTSSQH